MAQLQKACYASDARLRIRADSVGRARMGLQFAFAVPFGCYLLYHTLAPAGVMQNARASQGAYMYWVQNFMSPLKSQQ